MISQENLIEKETIIFKDLSDILGPNVHEQSFVFKGFIFGICTKGYIKLKINYNTHHICQNGIFIIIPQHIIHIKECSSDFEMKVMHILPDFLCALPITPDFNLLKQTASTPCLQLQEKDSEEIITLYLLAELNYKRFMFKKLCILLIFSKLNEIKHLIDKYRMHNLYAIFAKLLNICKQIAGNLVNESGNVPRRGVVPKFSDLEVVALNMASEAVGIDSESLLFANLQEYRVEIPNLISRRQYNDRRKITSSLCNAIRERMVAKMDGGEDYFCIDSKPIEVCRIARSKRCSMGKKDFSKAPGVGYCASQSMYYYGYKLHAVCGLSGVIHSFDLTKASVHDIHYLKDVKVDYSNCTVIGDRGYISAQVQLDLFETANIRLEVPYRCNQKEWKPTFPAFAKARKRIETLFSQLCDQFMIIRNYAKDTDGLFARIIGKISALTILQYINYKNEKPIGRVKYALF